MIARLQDENKDLKIQNKNLNDLLSSQFDNDYKPPVARNSNNYDNECTICVMSLDTDQYCNDKAAKIRLDCEHT